MKPRPYDLVIRPRKPRVWTGYDKAAGEPVPAPPPRECADCGVTKLWFTADPTCPGCRLPGGRG